MTDAWWNPNAAAIWLAANRPCNSIEHAQHLISLGIEDGTLPTRYRLDNGVTGSIEPSEWCRLPGEYLVQWQGYGRVTTEHEYMGMMGPEVEAAAVRRLCEPTQGRDERAERRGRKPGPDGLRDLIEEAARAVLPNGRRPGMSKKAARTLMSEYIRKEFGRPPPDDRTYRRCGH